MPVDTNKSKVKTPVVEQEPAVRAANFEEVSLGYTEAEAIEEAHRCIDCPKRPCVSGCPVGVRIPEFIEALRGGNVARAYAVVKYRNTLPAICGRVCPQESQCEGQCTRGRNGEPVAIGRLERFVADWALDHPEEAAQALAEEFKEHESMRDLDVLKGRKVAMIGAGPASLTCAGELARRGIAVTVFEALHEVGGVLSYGIPEFRLPKQLVAREVGEISAQGVSFETDVVIGKLYDIAELKDQGFEAVFIGTGAGLPIYLNIEGEGLNGVMVANELLTRVNLMKAFRFPEYATPVYAGKHCIVVGGGNVAMDAARTAKRLGADVTVVYRRSREEMPARDEEIHHAEEEGIKFELLTNPLKLVSSEEGWVAGAVCEKMELGEPDAGGRRRPVPIEGSEFTIDCDMFVVAVGSKTNPLIGKTTEGLTTSDKGIIEIDEATGATSVPGIFAGGDVATGAATVILAMGAGKRAAGGIIQYLKNNQ